MTLAERGNGASWTVQSTPNPKGEAGSGNGGTLEGVSCSSTTACTAVGYFDTLANSVDNEVTLAERWNGVSWTVQSTPNPKGGTNNDLSGVSCTSATACTAVGNYTNSDDAPLVERWDGTSWTIQSTPTSPGGGGAVLSGVSCTSATPCTAVGSSGAVTFAEAWNGRKWTVQRTPNPSGGLVEELYGVSCTSATDCTAAGDYTDSQVGNGPPLVERWDGTSWTIQSTPNPPGDSTDALNGVSCAAATACTAVGGDLHQINSSTPPLAEGYA